MSAPAPWVVSELDWRVIQDDRALVVADVRVPGADGGRDVARLVAAAPELLEAAIEVLRILDTSEPGPAERALRAAVEKARGES